jgi:hypothetical protein
MITKQMQYDYLKNFIATYGTRKTHNPMLLRVFKSILLDIESDIITHHMKGKK